MTTDMTSLPLVHTLPGADAITAERHTYATADGPLPFDLYRPAGAGAATGAVVFVSGYPDPAMAARMGKPIKDWASYQQWCRLVAASGLIAIAYENRTPADVLALVAHLRAHAGALGVDPARLGVWACSGNAPTGLALLAKERLAAAALLYGYLLDVDGASEVADAARQFFFATLPLTLDDLPPAPMLVVRAAADATPGLDTSLVRFVAAAQRRGLPVRSLEHPGPHAFDLLDPSPRSREVIEEVLAFLRRHLG